MRLTPANPHISVPVPRNAALGRLARRSADSGREALAQFPTCSTRTASADVIASADARTSLVAVAETLQGCFAWWQATRDMVERPWIRPIFDDRALVRALNAGVLPDSRRPCRLPLRVSVSNGGYGTGFVYATAVTWRYFPYPIPPLPPEEAVVDVRAIPVSTGVDDVAYDESAELDEETLIALATGRGALVCYGTVKYEAFTWWGRRREYETRFGWRWYSEKTESVGNAERTRWRSGLIDGAGWNRFA